MPVAHAADADDAVREHVAGRRPGRAPEDAARDDRNRGSGRGNLQGTREKLTA
jgi:hypothetical protein